MIKFPIITHHPLSHSCQHTTRTGKHCVLGSVWLDNPLNLLFTSSYGFRLDPSVSGTTLIEASLDIFLSLYCSGVGIRVSIFVASSYRGKIKLLTLQTDDTSYYFTSYRLMIFLKFFSNMNPQKKTKGSGSTLEGHCHLQCNVQNLHCRQE